MGSALPPAWPGRARAALRYLIDRIAEDNNPDRHRDERWMYDRHRVWLAKMEIPGEMNAW